MESPPPPPTRIRIFRCLVETPLNVGKVITPEVHTYTHIVVAPAQSLPWVLEQAVVSGVESFS